MKRHSCKSNRWENEVLGEVDLTSPEELISILKKSKKAFTIWSTVSTWERVQTISSFLEIYKDNASKLAINISKEIGKPLSQAMSDIDYDIAYLQRHIDNAEKILDCEIVFEDDTSKHIQYFEPKGVAAVISPRNFPSSQFIWQVIPPLLAGNTIIYKPASACMRSAKLISDLLISVLPTNTFQLVLGDSELGNSLVQLETDMTIFTGSSDVGHKISNINGNSMKPSYLELWGNAPGIVLSDAIIDNQMMNTLDQFRIQHSGQICDGLKRLFVHRSRYHELIDKIKITFSDYNIGNPLDKNTHIGCLINTTAYDKIQKSLDDVSMQWVDIISLWKYDNTVGPFIPFALLLNPENNDVLSKSVFMMEEIFAPILPIIAFDTIEEAIQMANDSKFGLGWY